MKKYQKFYISITLGFILIVLWAYNSNKYIKIFSYIIWIINLIIGQLLDSFFMRKII